MHANTMQAIIYSVLIIALGAHCAHGNHIDYLERQDIRALEVKSDE